MPGRRVHLLFVLPLLASMPRHANASVDARCTSAEEVRVQWEEALKQKDLAAVSGMYAEDAAFLEPSGQVHSGRAAIVSLFKQVTSQFDSKIVMTPAASRCSGTLAFERGAYSETLTTRADHQTQMLDGSYAMVMERVKGSAWHILYQAWTVSPSSPTSQPIRKNPQ